MGFSLWTEDEGEGDGGGSGKRGGGNRTRRIRRKSCTNEEPCRGAACSPAKKEVSSQTKELETEAANLDYVLLQRRALFVQVLGRKVISKYIGIESVEFVGEVTSEMNGEEIDDVGDGLGVED